MRADAGKGAMNAQWLPKPGEPNEVLTNESEALRSIIQLVPGGVFVYSAEADERFVFISENMLTLLGYTREQFDKKFDGRFSQMVWQEDRARVLREIDEQIAAGDYDTCSYRIEKQDGSLLWVHDEGHIVTDPDGHRWFYVVIVDITEAVRQKENLSSQNLQMRALLDNIPVSIVVFRRDEKGVHIAVANGYLHNKVRNTAGDLYPTDETGLLGIIHPMDRTLVRDAIKRIFEKDCFQEELSCRIEVNAEKEYRWYHCDAVRRSQPDGTELVYAVFTDATYRKQQEKEFNRILQELLAASEDSLYLLRLDITGDSCLDAAGAMPEVLRGASGQTAAAMLARAAAVLENEEEAREFAARYSVTALRGDLHKGRAYRTEEHPMRFSNGDVRWVTVHVHLMENPYTGAVEAIFHAVDTDHAHKEAEILSVITGDEYEAIGLVDAQGEKASYFFLSPGEKAAWGYLQSARWEECAIAVSRHVPEGRQRETFLQNSDRAAAMRALANKNEYIFSYTSVDAEGVSRRKQVSFRYLDETKREVLFCCSDVTEAFRREEEQVRQLQHALLEAERANEMKSNFLGSVSHDMRTPLNAILGYDGLALAAKDPAEKDDYLHKIAAAGDTLLSLINDTLDLQRIENGAAEMREENISCEDVASDIIASVRPLMDKKHITFSFDNSRAVTATIRTDLTRLRKIFINILSNAAKFTPEGGCVVLSVVCESETPDCIRDCITVQDNGVGMSQEFQKRMFEPFAQERTKETADIEGSGLGLSIVRRIVDSMGGRIEVESALGKGTRFSVHLDFARVPDECADKAAESELTEAGDIAGCRVLLCEDNAMNREIARRILESNGAAVTQATDGAEGVQAFLASPQSYDIILMDIRMPNMDGYTATRHIRDSDAPNAKTVPILAISADAYAADVQRALKMGMNGHVAKPFDPHRMLAEIARLTRREKEKAQ